MLFTRELNSEQRKASSRPSVRNTAEITPSDGASQSQISIDLPSPGRPKRARVTAKVEREEPTSLDLVPQETTGPVGRKLRYKTNGAKRSCRILLDKPENPGEVGDAGKPSRLLREPKLWLNVHLLHQHRRTRLYLPYWNLSHRHQPHFRQLRNSVSNP